MAYKTKTTDEKILHRLKIARGQLDKVITMVEDKEYCMNVLHQSQAIQKALEETDNVMLENHLKTCMVDHVKNNDSDTAIDEIMKVFRRKGANL